MFKMINVNLYIYIYICYHNLNIKKIKETNVSKTKQKFLIPRLMDSYFNQFVLEVTVNAMLHF